MNSKNVKPHLILIRGIPGAGKSTLANMLRDAFIGNREPWEHFENDKFHEDEEGNYKWKAENVPFARVRCFKATKFCLSQGMNVIVSNTFTKRSDYREYLDLCRQKGYRLTVLTVEGDHGSIHNIPKDKMDHFRRNMRNPFQF